MKKASNTNLQFDKHLSKILKFREQRDWKKFHNPKDLALSLVLESTEVLEHFQWKNGGDIDQYIKEHKEEIGDELADVLYWVFLLAYDLEVDLSKAMARKQKKNEQKYPVSKAKGVATKYNKF